MTAPRRGTVDGVTPLRRTDRAAATRARILDETIRVLEVGGDDAVKVLEIAAAAEVSTGSIYHHFDGRDGLVVAARLEQFRAAVPSDLAAIEWAVVNSQSVAEFRSAITRVARAAHSPDRAANRRTRADVVSAARIHPALAAALADEQHRLAESIEGALVRAQARGLVDPTLPAHAVGVFFMGLAFGMLMADIDTHRPVDRDDWQLVVDRLIDRVLTGHDPSPRG